MGCRGDFKTITSILQLSWNSMGPTPTPIRTLGMRLSCNFVNVYTIAYRIQYTYTCTRAHPQRTSSRGKARVSDKSADKSARIVVSVRLVAYLYLLTYSVVYTRPFSRVLTLVINWTVGYLPSQPQRIATLWPNQITRHSRRRSRDVANV